MTQQGNVLCWLTPDIFVHESPTAPAWLYWRSEQSGLAPLTLRIPEASRDPETLKAIWTAYQQGRSISYSDGYDAAKAEIREALGL